MINFSFHFVAMSLKLILVRSFYVDYASWSNICEFVVCAARNLSYHKFVVQNGGARSRVLNTFLDSVRQGIIGIYHRRGKKKI